MNKTYIVEILVEVITPVSVNAFDEQSAITLALDSKGEPGDQYELEPRVFTIKSYEYDEGWNNG